MQALKLFEDGVQEMGGFVPCNEACAIDRSTCDKTDATSLKTASGSVTATPSAFNMLKFFILQFGRRLRTSNR